MALFNDNLIQMIAQRIYEQQQALGSALGQPALPKPPLPLDEQSPLYGELNLLIRIANGEYTRSQMTSTLTQQIEAALRHLLDLLLGNALHVHVPISDEFWTTEIGVLVSRVRWWLSVDDLITISNAAALAFGENTQANRMRIARAMDKGVLDWIPDPSMTNPQQNKRALRSQVERLRDQRRLPE